MFEHMGDLRWSDAGKRERRKFVLRKKLGASGFMAVLSRTTLEFTEEEKFVGVKGMRRVPMEVAVVKRRKLGDANVVAGLFSGFACGGEARRFTDIGPAAGEGPAAVVKFADEEYAAVVKDGRTDVNFRSGVARLPVEKCVDRLNGWERSARGHDLRGDRADLVIALDVKFILAIGEARLGDGLETARPVEPLRIVHENILAGRDQSDKNAWTASFKAWGGGRPLPKDRWRESEKTKDGVL